MFISPQTHSTWAIQPSPVSFKGQAQHAPLEQEILEILKSYRDTLGRKYTKERTRQFAWAQQELQERLKDCGEGAYLAVITDPRAHGLQTEELILLKAMAGLISPEQARSLIQELPQLNEQKK